MCDFVGSINMITLPGSHVYLMSVAAANGDDTFNGTSEPVVSMMSGKSASSPPCFYQ